jgi:hypothetical protein
MRRPIFATTLFAILGIGFPAAADGAARPPIREYKSMWEPVPESEHMWFAEDFASFSFLRGHMALAYAGMMPPQNDSSYPNIKIYRIVNADEFFSLNKGNNEYLCRTPVRWLGVSSVDGPANPNNSDIRVMFYHIADYLAFQEDKPGLCASYPYRPNSHD